MGENGLLEKVKHAINGNTTVKGLMNDLQDAGIKVKNELEAVILAEDYWIKINDIERGPLENYKADELKELPFTSVTNNGIEYRIHGITHDTVNKKVLSAKTKDFYRMAILKLSNTKNKEQCLCEPAMGEVFGLKNTKEIDIGELFPYEIKNLFSFLFNIKEIGSIRRKVSDELVDKMFGNDERWGKALFRTRGDINYLPLLREVYKRHQFPLPLEIEKRNLKFNIYSANSNNFSKRLSIYFCRPALSREYAKSINEFTQINKPRVLHFVAGLAHEAEITYYFRNS